MPEARRASVTQPDPEPLTPAVWGLLDPSVRWLATQTLPALQRLETAMALTQSQVDAYAAAVAGYATQVQQATDGLAADLQALKDQIGPEVDTSGLDAGMARLTAAAQALGDLDAANPPPA
jgi:enoyl-CoA hydratase/carnithine racemase